MAFDDLCSFYFEFHPCVCVAFVFVGVGFCEFSCFLILNTGLDVCFFGS